MNIYLVLDRVARDHATIVRHHHHGGSVFDFLSLFPYEITSCAKKYTIQMLHNTSSG